MRTCSLCDQEFPDLPQSGRCNECQSLKSRLYRQFNKSGGAEKRQWESLTKEQRQVFYSQWHGQVGIDLKAAISELVVEAYVESKQDTSTKAFKWLDDYELKKKYEGREEQIKNIKENAESMECKVRGVTLYADPDYSSSEVATLETSRERRRELRADEISRPHKKPRTDPAVKSEPGKLTDKQLSTLATEKIRLLDLHRKVQLTNSKAELPDLVDCVTKRDRDQLKLSEMKIKATIQTIDMFIESGTGNFKDVRKDIGSARGDAHANHQNLKRKCLDAEKDLSPEKIACVTDAVEAYEDELNNPPNPP